MNLLLLFAPACLCRPQGFLTPEQLTSIMQNAELGLTGPELHLVIAEADDNADGTIDVRNAHSASSRPLLVSNNRRFSRRPVGSHV